VPSISSYLQCTGLLGGGVLACGRHLDQQETVDCEKMGKRLIRTAKRAKKAMKASMSDEQRS
jgi:hypothetical protein